MAKLIVYTVEVGQLPKENAEAIKVAAEQEMTEKFGAIPDVVTMVLASRNSASHIMVYDL